MQVDEGDSIRITLTLSGIASGGGLTVATTNYGGTATPTADFTSPTTSDTAFTGTILNSASLSRYRTYTIVNDATPEPDETITLAVPTVVALTSSDTLTRGPDLVIVIRRNDGYVPTYNLAITGPATLTETDADFMSGNYTVTRSGDEFTESTVVNLAVTHTSTSAADITVPASVTFAAGDDTETFQVTVTGDSLNEAAEMFSLRTAGGSGLTHAAALAVTLNDNDDIASVTVADASAVSEGASTDFTVTLDHASAGVVTVAWSAAIGGSMGGTPDPASGNLQIPAGMTSADIAIGIPFNSDLGDGETRTLTVTLGTVTIASPGRGTVTTSDTATATVNYLTAAHTIAIADATVAEGAADITVTRSGPALTSSATVTWTATAGTATAADFAGGVLPSDTVTFAGDSMMQTIRIPVADDALSEAAESFTLTLSADAATLASNMQIALGAPATITITDNDTIGAMTMTLRGPATLNEERAAEYTVDLGAEVTGTAVTVGITAAGTATMAAMGNPGDYSLSATSITIMPGARSGVFTVTATDGGGDDTPDRSLLLTLTATGGANTATMAAISRTIAILEDDPVARGARLEAPVVAAARGVGMLAAAAVEKRLRFNAAASEFNLGRAATTDELLRRSGFSIAHGGGGFNFWGGGAYVSAKGDHAGVTYDGDTSALHLGADTQWRGGLIGVSIARSSGDMDFTVTADGMKSTLETEVTSVHPYLTRKFGEVQLWTTIGHGSGDAELREPDTVIKTDLTVTTAALGASFAPWTGVALSADGVFTRAELDAAAAASRRLPKVTVDNLRVNAAAELSGRRDAWRSFLTVNLRHDSGDGDTGAAGDLGGGVEWQSPTVNLRLEGAKYLTGSSAEEERLNFTASKTAGRLNLGLAVGMEDGLTTANLLSGEWRF